MENLNESSPVPESASQVSPQPNNKRLKILCALLVLLILGAAWFFYRCQKDSKLVSVPVELTQKIEVPAELSTTPVNTAPVLSMITKEEYEKKVALFKKQPEGLKPEECSHHTNSFEYVRCYEQFAAKEFPGVIRIDNSCVEVILASGAKKALCDDPDQTEWPARYSFMEKIPDVGFFFHAQYHEGNGWVIINEKTGDKMDVCENFYFSPSGNKFLSVCVDDTEAQYNANGFQVWEKQGDSYVNKVNYFAYSGYPITNIINPIWVDENSFYFIKRTFDWPPEELAYPKISEEYAQFSF